MRKRYQSAALGGGRSRQQQIRALREQEGVSLTVSASYLNVTPNIVSEWERGEEKRTAGRALKLLLLIRKGGNAAGA
jgi:putative transcriptional regulator